MPAFETGFGNNDARLKSEIDFLIKEYEISRREMADATSRNFDYSRFIFVSTIAAMAAVLASLHYGADGHLDVIYYCAAFFVFFLSIYLLNAVSTYAFIVARSSYELRYIRPLLVYALNERNILMWDADPEAPLKAVWMNSGIFLSVISAFSIIILQIFYFIIAYGNIGFIFYFAVLILVAALDVSSLYYFGKMIINLDVFRPEKLAKLSVRPTPHNNPLATPPGSDPQG